VCNGERGEENQNQVVIKEMGRERVWGNKTAPLPVAWGAGGSSIKFKQ